ncbi:PKD domain-containing protein [Marivirga sp. S37H4]|uniref:PKD domain-containing protein n=1 Tax=Marivirga aurantiaca TaxID=2802615 RepID=A0A935C6F3_9BACT|nr:PKD domain-containing protein [Marivirga aurantiaca]MBK6264339.1 PKD domain-containing protein [Marivirga aurantiaca]
MKKLDIKLRIKSFVVLGLLLIGISCTPENEDLSLGQKAEAAFTVEAIEGMRNTYLLNSSTHNAFLYEWDLGTGAEPFAGGQTDTAFFEDKGSYTVTLTTLSAGGHSTSSEEVEVATDAVAGTSAVVGGDMSDPSVWNFMNTGSTETVYEFQDGAVHFSNSDPAQSNIAMWQEVTLKGGRAYTFDADLQGSGMMNSWMEVILLDEAPEEGIDPQGSVFTGLNTWTGCGTDAFDNALSELSCLGDGNVNIAEDGEYYLVIKIGSWDGYLGTEGLILDNVEFIAQERLTEGANILSGSSMDDASLWTITDMGMALTDVEIADGVMNFSNGTESTQTNVGVWQSVEVEAGQIYKLKATVDNAGATGSWTEFYVSTTAPVDGVDYTTGRVEPGATKSFAEAGTVYVLIKVGSWDGNLGADGVTIDDVELVEMN